MIMSQINNDLLSCRECETKPVINPCVCCRTPYVNRLYIACTNFKATSNMGQRNLATSIRRVMGK